MTNLIRMYNKKNKKKMERIMMILLMMMMTMMLMGMKVKVKRQEGWLRKRKKLKKNQSVRNKK